MIEPYLDPDQSRGEFGERLHCAMTDRPFLRLTVNEQRYARSLIVGAAAAGHERLCWRVPALPWPVGAVWPDERLWAVRVVRPYAQGPVTLTARRCFGRRYVVSVLREAPADAPA